MKKTSYQINIASPCQENWENMKEIQEGRYCSQCCKSVIDFTNMSDREIIRILEKKTNHLCGRFTIDQVNRPLVNPTTSHKQHHSLLLAGLLLLGMADFSFAKPPLKANTELAIYADQNSKGEIFDDFTPKDSIKNTIEGRVTNGSNGLDRVRVQIKDIKISTLTNKNGYYKLTIPDKIVSKNIKLVFVALGCRSQEIVIPKKQLPLRKDIALEMQQMIAGIIAPPKKGL